MDSSLRLHRRKHQEAVEWGSDLHQSIPELLRNPHEVRVTHHVLHGRHVLRLVHLHGAIWPRLHTRLQTLSHLREARVFGDLLRHVLDVRILQQKRHVEAVNQKELGSLQLAMLAITLQ